MIANVSAHRRANAFAQALEDQAAAQRYDEGADPAPDGPDAPGDPRSPASPAPAVAGRPEQVRMLALSTGLGELPKPELDPEVKVVQRAQLVAAMEAMFREGTAGAATGETTGPTVPEQRKAGRGAHRASPLRKLRPRSRWSKGLAAGGLTVGVAAGAFGGVAAASSDALPGDSLYGLKRGMEDIRLGMADGEADRGELYLDQASTRLNEARRLMERARSGSMDHESIGEVRRALNGMRHDVREAHRLLHSAYERNGSLGPIRKLNSFSQSHREKWNGLRERLPVQLTDVSNEVDDVFTAMEQEVEPLQSLLPSPPEQGRGSELPGTSSPKTTERPSGDARTTPSAPGSTPAPGTDSRPGPSNTGSGPATPKDQGLLGGAGDLLDPPAKGTTPPADGRATPTPRPDITLPPLLPGLLPGLGLSAEEDR
ncbi:DUF5667 domain-containing protein [Streptomyces qinzhouensis]|uniref:DUF5667 domain-containing protein n=1 Tax=Streptomyces qinzhouensis TaxID=2599401 RepID=A0A5B8JAF1_9ACTN|nr:DUF5667 domain-containing protein [Streptomyces qinzhouensis]QDY78357.1 hypothetical protein FQU76_19770 [Streptomyces qinzhouensis]